MYQPGLYTLCALIIPDGALLDRKRTPGDFVSCLAESGLRASYSCEVRTGENRLRKILDICLF